MDEQAQELENLSEEIGRRSQARILGIILLALTAVVALYLVVGYLGWQSGQTLRSNREQQQIVQQLTHQIDLAQEDIEQESYVLASRRLEWVLERDPANDEAVALLRQVQAALNTALTPIAPPTVTPSPEPTVHIDDAVDPGDELRRLKTLYNREQWRDLLPGVLAFQRQFPNFERGDSDRLLYHAYLNLGQQLVQGDQIEKGIMYLAQAEKLGDLPQEALDFWLWADLYLEGIAYYGVNWGVATSVFRDLCLSAPFYQNSCDKLYDSLVNYGDQYLFNQDFCPAVDLLREARRYGSDQSTGEKLSSAEEGCALATPKPPAITGTLPVTGTESLPLPETE